MNPMQWSFTDGNRIGLLIDPLDTLFFRDGRPFGAGDSARGGLPMPQTLYGMIQRHVRRKLGILDEPIHGRRDEEGAWHRHVAVRGPWLAKVKDGKVSDLYLPAPANLVREGKEKNSPIRILSPLSPTIEIPGWEPPHWAEPTQPMRPVVALGCKEKAEPVGGYLTLDGMRSYLRGESPTPVGGDTLFVHEGRVGIAVDGDKQTAADGALYSARHLRLVEGVYFYAEIGLEGVHASSIGELRKLFGNDGVTMPFGGEGRRVHVTQVNAIDWPKAEEGLSSDAGGFTTVLISPAMLEPRAYSTGLSWHPPQLGRLCAAASGKPLAVSGWSLGERVLDEDQVTVHQDRTAPPNHPKPTRYAVNAGAVYFWQNGRNAEPGKVVSHMQLTHRPLDRAHGWGVALRGVWKWER